MAKGSADHIKISTSLKWMRPYLEVISDLVPLPRLQKIETMKTPLDRQSQADAIITKTNNGWYYMRINTWSPVWANLGESKFKKIKYTKEPLANTLDSLAHELSHMVHWEHKPEHLMLQAQILVRFAKKAQVLGVTDTYNKRGYYKIMKDAEERY